MCAGVPRLTNLFRWAPDDCFQSASDSLPPHDSDPSLSNQWSSNTGKSISSETSIRAIVSSIDHQDDCHISPHTVYLIFQFFPYTISIRARTFVEIVQRRLESSTYSLYWVRLKADNGQATQSKLTGFSTLNWNLDCWRLTKKYEKGRDIWCG
jgi:hypothetical protein